MVTFEESCPQMTNSKHLANDNQGNRVYRIKLKYDGRSYYGWQRLRDLPTIQNTVENAIFKAFGITTKVIGAGRTDRGVHANGQIASIYLPSIGNSSEFLSTLNRHLPNDIVVTGVDKMNDDWHPLKSALGKIYRYVIWNEMECPPDVVGTVWHIPTKLDIDDMRSACNVLVGKHDFASFATIPKFKQKSTTREIYYIKIIDEHPKLSITIYGDGFLYKMVRNIIRVIVKTGEGKLAPEKMVEILQSRSRKASPGTAPASGLYLDGVIY